MAKGNPATLVFGAAYGIPEEGRAVKISQLLFFCDLRENQLEFRSPDKKYRNSDLRWHLRQEIQ